MFRSRILKGLLVVGLVALSSGAAFAEELPKTIRFAAFGSGYGKPFGTALLAIAHVKGFIADEFKGTPVELTFTYPTGTGPAINEGIASGQIDFAQYGGLPNIVGKANGLPTKIIARYGATTIIGVARNGVPISSIKDLKGKRVTVAKGTILHWAFLKALKENGLTVKDLKLVDLANPDQRAALAAGSVDAAISSSIILALRNQGIVKVFYRSTDIGRKAEGFGSILATEQFLSKYPEATARVVRGLVKAAYWLSKEENRAEAYRVWAQSGNPEAIFAEEFKGQALKNVFSPVIDAFFIDQYRDATAFSKEEGLIRKDIDLAKWFEPKYLDAALKDLGLEDYWTRHAADGS
jgi:sulfonate transport system substrate-binding protein